MALQTTSTTDAAGRAADLQDRETTARRLLRTSAKHGYDPEVDIDWDAPQPADRFYLSPEHSSLYGTDLWSGLTDEQRVELTKHEVASIMSVGIWFEAILMQMLIRHIYDQPASSAHVRFAYTEIADECRHSTMFSRFCEVADANGYWTGRKVHQLGRLLKTLSTDTLTFAGAMYVEEILDALQREWMADEKLQPLVRMTSRIHVIEEARHIKFAREEIRRVVPTLGRFRRAWARLILGLVVYYATTSLIDPRVYAAVGLEPATAARAAADNPNWRETKKFMGRKVVTFLDEMGLIAGPGKWYWRRAGVL